MKSSITNTGFVSQPLNFAIYHKVRHHRSRPIYWRFDGRLEELHQKKSLHIRIRQKSNQTDQRSDINDIEEGKGDSNEVKTNHVLDSQNESLQEMVSGTQVELTMIYEERKNYEIKVGFIKVDLENSELMALLGASSVLKRDRPVQHLSLSQL